MIQDVLKILEKYLSNSIVQHKVLVRPDKFLIENLLQFCRDDFLTIEKYHKGIEKEIRNILGFDKYFEFFPGNGCLIWQDFKTHRSVLDFASIEMSNFDTLEIKELQIYLTTKEGKLKDIISHHDKLVADGYILNKEFLKNMRNRFNFLLDDNVSFISNEKSTVFLCKEKNVYHGYSNHIGKFPWIVIPNELINFL